MKIIKWIILAVTITFQNYLFAVNLSNAYEYRLTEFDSANDARLFSEFMAVTTLLEQLASHELKQSAIGVELQHMLVNSYAVSHHLDEQRTIKCDSPLTICVKSVIAMEIDIVEYKKYINESIEGVLHNSVLLLANYQRMRSKEGSASTSTVNDYVNAIISGSESILRLRSNTYPGEVSISQHAPLEAIKDHDPHVLADEAKDLATNILKKLQREIDTSVFKPSSETAGDYFKLKITSNFNSAKVLNSLLYEQILTKSNAMPAPGTNGCGPVFSKMYLDMKIEGYSPNPRTEYPDSYYYRPNSNSGISTYEFPTAKNVGLVIKDRPGLLLVGICDTGFYSDLQRIRTADVSPWSKDGQKLECDANFDCVLRGALSLLENASIEIWVNDIRVCELIKFSDWSKKRTPVLDSERTINRQGSVKNEVRVPSIHIRKGECNYFAKGAEPKSMNLTIKFNLPNKSMF